MRTVCFLAFAFAALPALAETPAETPLEKALAGSKEGPAYKFDLKIDDNALNARTEVDPSRPKGDRLVLISPGENELDDAAATRLAELKQTITGENVWCSSFTENIPTDAKLISESREAAVYAFQPRADAESPDNAKIYRHLTGRVTVSKEKPAIIAFEMFAEKPFKPGLAARVDSFNMKAICDYAPDGRTYIREFALDVAGSAMMKPFSQSERREVSNLVALPETASGQR